MKNFKNIFIVILIVLIVIFAILVVRTGKDKNTSSGNTVADLYDVDSALSKDAIYQEVYTEVMLGEEKHVEHADDGTRVNTSTKIQEVQHVNGKDDVVIQGLNITAKDGITTITGTAKNTSNSENGDFMVYISLLDDSNTEILEIGAYINQINPKGEVEFTAITSTDLANAYDYSVTKK